MGYLAKSPNAATDTATRELTPGAQKTIAFGTITIAQRIMIAEISSTSVATIRVGVQSTGARASACTISTAPITVGPGPCKPTAEPRICTGSGTGRTR